MDAKATSESTLPTWPSQEQVKAASTLKLAPYTLEGSAAVSPARAGTALMSEPRALSSAAVSAGHPQVTRGSRVQVYRAVVSPPLEEGIYSILMGPFQTINMPPLMAV